jgi:hypothetical protein
MNPHRSTLATTTRHVLAAAATCAALLAGQTALATPVNIVSTDGAGRDLGTLLNSTWRVSGATTDIQGGQYTPDETWTLSSTTMSANRLVFEFAGNANSNAFGIYDRTEASCTAATFASCRRLTIFSGAASSGAAAALQEDAPGEFSLLGGPSAQFGSSDFGYFLSGAGGTFFSESALNEFGTDHLVAYAGQGQAMRWPYTSTARTWGTGEILLAWEDLPATRAGGQPGDWDYNDMLVMVNSVHSVPEPATLGLLGLGLLGTAALRRRRVAA